VRVRLQRILAAAGVASRRRAEELIAAGRVRVNGTLAGLGDSADPEQDVVTLDGVALHEERTRYWVVHKPRGVLTTVRDPQGRPTVLDLLPRREARLFPVGRLDRDTEGLVLLTNDGPLAHALLHPSLGNEREYQVTVLGDVPPEALRRLESGVELEDGRTAPARVGGVRREAASGTTSFHLTLVEGRKRQIRRALTVLGHPVRRLLRVRLGPLRLGLLPPGAARPLTTREVAALQRHARRLAERRAQRPAGEDGSA